MKLKDNVNYVSFLLRSTRLKSVLTGGTSRKMRTYYSVETITLIAVATDVSALFMHTLLQACISSIEQGCRGST